MKFILISFVMLSNLCWAAFSGTWSGVGRGWDTEGFTTHCRDVGAVIEQSPSEIQFKKIYWDCDEAGFERPELRFTIKNGKLLSDTKEVGSIDASHFEVVLPDLDLPTHFRFILDADGSMQFKEEWRGKNMTFHVEATLIRK